MIGSEIGAFAKSNVRRGSGSRDAVYADEMAIATSYAEAYVKMGFEPLYFGVTTLEEVAGPLDWRFDREPLNRDSRIGSRERYEYAFMLDR